MRELIDAIPFSGGRINFCPHCRFNLEIMTVAIGMAEKASNNR